VFWKVQPLRADRNAERLVAFDTDRSAVEAARRDPRHFEPLYRKYVGQVYSFAVYELRDHHAAEDATEQVFLRALSALPRFQERAPDPGGPSTFRVWLFQIARNVISNERRTRRRHPTASLAAAISMPASDDPAGIVADRDAAERAWRAVDRLPDARRRAVVLRFVEEMSPAEIAGVLGRSEGSVRVLIHRALRTVADELRGTPDAAQRRP
jgi:RNA polymerase sigma-70 factor (ECF subfamily)